MRTVAKFGLTLVAALALTVAVPLGVMADPIGDDTGCESCEGNIFLLQVVPLGGNQYQIILTVDTTGYTGPGGDDAVLNGVDFKLGGANFTLDSFSNTAGFDVTTFSNLNASAQGCTGEANSGFVCFGLSGTGVVGAGMGSDDGGVYTFTANITLISGSLCTTDCSVQALYLREGPQGQVQAALTSENITLQPIPEPASMLLFGTGLLSMAGALRKRFRR